jgi:excinuclease ABC subunit C
VIKNCSAPCIGKVTRDEYVARVEAACDFLEGQSREMTDQVECEMKAAAGRMEFEKAAQLRNLLEDLKTTTRPMTRFTRKSLPSTINPESDVSSLQAALELDAAPEVMECFDISNISSTHIVASMVRFRGGVPDRANYRTYRIKGLDHQDDFASMAEVVRRRYGRVLREVKDGNSPLTLLPNLIIVDGGRGQLSSACGELKRLGLLHIPIIGLAKEFEEIHRPNHLLPMLLPQDSGALRLLQRIRDEAHRTANAYHSLLLKKRVRESLLDEVPGISAARKRALLERFGSVERIKSLDPSRLAEVSGISQSLAERITATLNAN